MAAGILGEDTIYSFPTQDTNAVIQHNTRFPQNTHSKSFPGKRSSKLTTALVHQETSKKAESPMPGAAPSPTYSLVDAFKKSFQKASPTITEMKMLSMAAK
jgi:hypothetical protein